MYNLQAICHAPSSLIRSSSGKATHNQMKKARKWEKFRLGQVCREWPKSVFTFGHDLHLLPPFRMTVCLCTQCEIRICPPDKVQGYAKGPFAMIRIKCGSCEIRGHVPGKVEWKVEKSCQQDNNEWHTEGCGHYHLHSPTHWKKQQGSNFELNQKSWNKM